MIQNLQRQLDIAISINISFSSAAESKAAVKALIPDNVNFPKGLRMKILANRRMLEIHLVGKKVPIAVVLSTLDEVLEHISISKKVMTLK